LFHVRSKAVAMLPGRSGKTNGIVIEAKCAPAELFRQETGWREPKLFCKNIC
jgi:hypothetical protein